MRHAKILIRYKEPPGIPWTAKSDLRYGVPYTYATEGLLVTVDWEEPPPPSPENTAKWHKVLDDIADDWFTNTIADLVADHQPFIGQDRMICCSCQEENIPFGQFYAHIKRKNLDA